MNKPEKLILDYSKWRCGGNVGENVLGAGETRLLNEEGFCCCIGLWSKQLGASDEDLMGIGDPSCCKDQIPLFVDESKAYYNSKLANDCIDINDNILTTPEQKIIQLKERLNSEGIQLEVINKP